MKNTILTTITIMIMATLALSQGQSFGVKGAYQISSLAVNNDQIDDTNIKSGYSIGLVNRTEKGALIVQTELLWSRKGAQYDLANSTTKVNANLDYIEIPMSVGLNLFGSPLSVYGGVYGAYLLKADYEYEDANENIFATYDNKDAFKKLDFGFQTGLQFKIGNILLDGRFSRGLRNVESDDIVISNQTFTANDTKNFNLQFSVGLLF